MRIRIDRCVVEELSVPIVVCDCGVGIVCLLLFLSFTYTFDWRRLETYPVDGYINATLTGGTAIRSMRKLKVEGRSVVDDNTPSFNLVEDRNSRGDEDIHDLYVALEVVRLLLAPQDLGAVEDNIVNGRRILRIRDNGSVWAGNSKFSPIRIDGDGSVGPVRQRVLHDPFIGHFNICRMFDDPRVKGGGHDIP